MTFVKSDITMKKYAAKIFTSIKPKSSEFVEISNLLDHRNRDLTSLNPAPETLDLSVQLGLEDYSLKKLKQISAVQKIENISELIHRLSRLYGGPVSSHGLIINDWKLADFPDKIDSELEFGQKTVLLGLYMKSILMEKFIDVTLLEIAFQREFKKAFQTLLSGKNLSIFQAELLSCFVIRHVAYLPDFDIEIIGKKEGILKALPLALKKWAVSKHFTNVYQNYQILPWLNYPANFVEIYDEKDQNSFSRHTRMHEFSLGKLVLKNLISSKQWLADGDGDQIWSKLLSVEYYNQTKKNLLSMEGTYGVPKMLSDNFMLKLATQRKTKGFMKYISVSNDTFEIKNSMDSNEFKMQLLDEQPFIQDGYKDILSLRKQSISQQNKIIESILSKLQCLLLEQHEHLEIDHSFIYSQEPIIATRTIPVNNDSPLILQNLLLQHSILQALFMKFWHKQDFPTLVLIENSMKFRRHFINNLLHSRLDLLTSLGKDTKQIQSLKRMLNKEYSSYKSTQSNQPYSWEDTIFFYLDFIYNQFTPHWISKFAVPNAMSYFEFLQVFSPESLPLPKIYVNQLLFLDACIFSDRLSMLGNNFEMVTLEEFVKKNLGKKHFLPNSKTELLTYTKGFDNEGNATNLLAAIPGSSSTANTICNEHPDKCMKLPSY